ncbi:MAG: rhamnulokinase [Propionibacteriaceae bacterium]|jgi:rhamnulokinase|nr:rhamnulokinase [Propionibacteriaceae bacterium]
MTNPAFFAAVDLGATSGRVILGRLADDAFTLEPVHRFTTPAFQSAGPVPHWHWRAGRLRAEIATGLARAQARAGRLDGVGVDTWGVDYGRLDASGGLLEEPFNYRDDRTLGVPERFFADFPAERLYDLTGLQVMPINTIFQLVAQADDPAWRQVDRMLWLPDLFNYWLSGVQATELTIASTSGLLDVAQRDWSPALLQHLDQRHGLDLSGRLAPIVQPGAVLGPLDPAVAASRPPVVAVASHDTASAIVAIPTASSDFAYISSGTWSLVGLELPQPITSPASRQANFTNELGLDGTVRYLQNVMGLWVLNQALEDFERLGQPHQLGPLLEEASAVEPLACVLDMSDDRLRAPGQMVARLTEAARRSGQPVPDSPAAWIRAILDSLALAYRRSIRAAQALSGRPVEVVHVVGGGCQNQLLCQLTAEALGRPVVAGPAEGTALGNLLVQARATGHLSGDLFDLRRVAAASCAVTTYRPGQLDLPERRWDEAESRLG